MRATINCEEAIKNTKYVIISTPTNYDDEKNYFDISNVEDIIQKVIQINSDAIMVVKSTISVGLLKI